MSPGNPILAEIDAKHAELSPLAKRAIGLSGVNPLPEAPALAPIAGGAPSMAAPAPILPNQPLRQIGGPTTARPLPSPLSQNSQYSNLVSEHTRLTDPTLPTSKSGIGQLHNPILRGLGHVGEIALSTFAPGAAMLTPGTQLHHNMLVHQNEGQMNQMQGQATAEANRQHLGAESAELDSRPELRATQAELARQKQSETETHHQAQIDVQREKETGTEASRSATLKGNLAAHGYKTDEQGNIVPLAYEEMSQEQQGVHDLKASQQELADATAALRKAQKDNIPMAAKLAQARIDTARQNAGVAAGRLGLSRDQFEAEYFGTHGGEQIPGTDTDEQGHPIGTKVSGQNKPTGMVASRAAQGTAIKEAGDQLLKEIDAKKGKAGNLESYWNQAINGTPIADPEAAGLMTSLASFAALQPALHGFRSHDALREFAKIIGGIPKNPDALKESIRSIQRTAGIIEQGGKRHSGQATGGGEQGLPKEGGTFNGHKVLKVEKVQ